MAQPAIDDRFMSTLLDALPAPILIHSSDAVLEANARARALLEADSTDQLRATPLSDLVHVDSQAASEARRLSLFESDRQAQPATLELMSLKGNRFEANTLATSFTFDDARYGVSIELGASRPSSALSARTTPPVTADPGSVIEAALHVLPLPVLAVSTRKVCFVNQATCEMLGATSPDDLLGMSAVDVLHPDARDAMHERVAPLICAEGLSLDLPLKALRLDGQSVRTSCLANCTSHADQPLFLFVATAYEPIPS